MAALAAAACGGSEAVPAHPRTLFDLLSQSSITSYPTSNLPRELRELSGAPFLLRSRVYEKVDWIAAGLIPARFLEALGPDTRVRYWRLQLELDIPEDGEPPRVLVEDARLADWDVETTPFPGVAVWYQAEDRALFALSEERIGGVRVECWTDAVREFAPVERLVAAEAGATSPALASLIRREELDHVSRRCLLLPAGAVAEVAFEAFPADALRVAVGAVDRSYRRLPGGGEPRLERSLGGSDGLSFALEVVSSGEERVVWEMSFPARGVGVGFAKDTVDLSAFRGLPVTLRLSTLPGAAGNSDFDYGLWSDLALLGVPEEGAVRPHVVLIDIDTLRADRMGCYGHERPTTPGIDAWAAEHASVYLAAKAPASWTLPSTASMLTGLAPHQHLLVDHDRRLAADVPTLASRLRDAGYETYSDVEGPFFSPGFGLDGGFEEHFNRGETEEADVRARWRRQARRLRERVDSRPVFLFLQTYLVHAPYRVDGRFEDADAPYDGPLAGKPVDYENVINPFLRGDLELSEADRAYIDRLYDAGIRRTDELVAALLDELDGAFAGEEALIIITSDHGEEFFDHGGMGHGHTLFEELLRVPLIVRFPGASRPRRVPARERVVSTLDIVPTVLDAAGLEVDPRLPGRSLLRPQPEDRALVANEKDFLESIESNGTKLIVCLNGNEDPLFPPTALFQLDEDPEEHVDLAAEREADAARLRSLLESFHEQHPVVAPLDAARSEFGSAQATRLKNLGYLGGD